MTFLRLQKRMVGESVALQKEDFFWALNTLCDIKKISAHEVLSIVWHSAALSLQIKNVSQIIN
jgi:hypothetical protein